MSLPFQGSGVELSLGAQASSPAGFSRRAVSASMQARTPALPGMATFLIQCHCPFRARALNVVCPSALRSRYHRLSQAATLGLSSYFLLSFFIRQDQLN